MKTIGFVALMGLAVAPVGALERGNTGLGQPYVSGGVGTTEQETLDKERADYDLTILTAARGSGDFLADVRIRITNARSDMVLDTVMDGPWLFVELPAGRYRIQASHNDRVQEHTVTFLDRGHRQTVFYFDDTMESEGRSP